MTKISPDRYYKMVPVEALRLENTKESISACVTFVCGKDASADEQIANQYINSQSYGFMFEMFQGGLFVQFGDYIVHEPGQGVYPCNASVFQKSHALIVEEEK